MLARLSVFGSRAEPHASAPAALALLALCASLVACDKKMLRENVQLPRGGEISVPSRNLDGGLVVDEPREAGIVGGSLSEIVDDEPREFSKANLLAAVGNCALATYRVFEQRAQALDVATARWAEDPSDESAAEARAAFRSAMDSFQRAELFRIGPAATAIDPGGRGLRDQIYAYPHNSACKVDEQLADESFRRSDFSSSTPIGRGLAALEYLFYYVGADNACAATFALNQSGSWQELSAAELKARRLAYAAVVAKDIARFATQLVHAFAPEGDDFVKELSTAGRGSKVYSTEQLALNALSHALYYVEIEVKDYKLALPLGISPNCTSGSTCPDAVESPYARVSTSNIAANLRGFRAIFQGCGTDHSGLGFDDWLNAVGQGALSRSMLKALDGAETAVRDLDLEPSLERAIIEDPSKVRAVYDAVKMLTDQLKQQFVTVLDLGAPMTAEGDND